MATIRLTTSKKKRAQEVEWETGKYTGEKIQIDVKYVPMECMSPELVERKERYYQYTAIDEYTRIRYTWFTNVNDKIRMYKKWNIKMYKNVQY